MENIWYFQTKILDIIRYVSMIYIKPTLLDLLVSLFVGGGGIPQKLLRNFYKIFRRGIFTKFSEGVIMRTGNNWWRFCGDLDFKKTLDWFGGSKGWSCWFLTLERSRGGGLHCSVCCLIWNNIINVICADYLSLCLASYVLWLLKSVDIVMCADSMHTFIFILMFVNTYMWTVLVQYTVYLRV